jgi:putative membrane protein
VTARLVLAVLHLLALGTGLGAVWGRSRALRDTGAGALRRALYADTWWGIAGAVWVATGLARLFMETEKNVSYYMRNPVFHAKMGMVLLIIVLEVWAGITMFRWRRAGGDAIPDPAVARRIAGISHAQGGLVVLAVIAAAMMARGVGGQ